jgi:hypothetical protein
MEHLEHTPASQYGGSMNCQVSPPPSTTHHQFQNRQIQNACQELRSKKRLIGDCESDFIRECTQFTRKISELNESPWNPTQNIISWIYTNTPIKLGNMQKKVLEYLQNEFFNCGKPCFVRQEYIAARMQCTKQQISNVLKSLERYKLIGKINWLFGRWNRVMIVPTTPEISDVLNWSDPAFRAFAASVLPVHVLFRNPPKSLEVSNSLYMYIRLVSTNKLKLCNTNVKQINSILQTLVSSETCTQEGADSQTPFDPENQIPLKGNILEQECRANEKEDSMESVKNKFVEKFALKRINPVGQLLQSSYSSLVERLKDGKWDWNVLGVSEQNTLATAIEYHTTMPFKKMYQISPRIQASSPTYARWTKEAQSQFLELLFTGFDFKFDYARDVVAFWNAKAKEYREINKVNKLRSIKIGETVTFFRTVSTITWCLYKTMGGRQDGIYNAIARLASIPPNRTTWAQRKDTLPLELFLGNYSGTKLFYNLLNAVDDKDFAIKQFSANKETERYLPLIEEVYLTTWKNEYKGKQYIRKHRLKLISFVDLMLTKLKTGEIETCGLKIFVPNPDLNHPALIERYIEWLNDSRFKNYRLTHGVVTIHDLIDPSNWIFFVDAIVRGELGYRDFWTNRKKPTKLLGANNGKKTTTQL